MEKGCPPLWACTWRVLEGPGLVGIRQGAWHPARNGEGALRAVPASHASGVRGPERSCRVRLSAATAPLADARSRRSASHVAPTLGMQLEGPRSARAGRHGRYALRGLASSQEWGEAPPQCPPRKRAWAGKELPGPPERGHGPLGRCALPAVRGSCGAHFGHAAEGAKVCHGQVGMDGTQRGARRPARDGERPVVWLACNAACEEGWPRPTWPGGAHASILRSPRPTIHDSRPITVRQRRVGAQCAHV